MPVRIDALFTVSAVRYIVRMSDCIGGGFLMDFRRPLFPRTTPHETAPPFRSPCRPDFHRAGGRETVCAHQRHADGQADGAAEAGRGLVEAAAFAEPAAHRAGHRAGAGY